MSLRSRCQAESKMETILILFPAQTLSGRVGRMKVYSIQHTNSKVMVWNSSEANKYWKCHILNSNNMYTAWGRSAKNPICSICWCWDRNFSSVTPLFASCEIENILYSLQFYTQIRTYIMYPRQYFSIFNNLLKNTYPPLLHYIPLCTLQDFMLLENSISTVFTIHWLEEFNMNEAFQSVNQCLRWCCQWPRHRGGWILSKFRRCLCAEKEEFITSHFEISIFTIFPKFSEWSIECH